MAGLLDRNFAPNLDLSFESLDRAYEFYRSNAEKAGFPLKKNRVRKNAAGWITGQDAWITGQEFCLSFEVKHKMKVGDDRKTAKTSKRGGCKAMVYARTTGDGGRAFFTRIVF